MGHGHDGRDDAANLEHFRTLLQEHMVKRGLRSTDQRRLIVETFFQAPNHISIGAPWNGSWPPRRPS
jgi:Fur family ferric uptake transcriptional regulator